MKEKSVKKISFDRSAMSWAYDMYVSGLFDAEGIPGLPFGSVYGSVPPGVNSKRHAHQDGEMFVVLKGTANVVLDGDSTRLQAGDALYIPPFTKHEIWNDAEEDFDIVSIGWDDAEVARDALETGTSRAQAELILAPPVTPNGGLHLGHMSGPYLRADLLRRMLIVSGTSARFVTGSDESQSYVDVRARQLGVDSRTFRDLNTARIESTLQHWGVKCDGFIAPSRDELIMDGVRRRFERLTSSARVRAGEVAVSVCVSCQQEAFQGHVSGSCPRCSAGSAGDLCEACGHPSTVAEMLDARCVTCGGELETVIQLRDVLDVASLGEQIRALASVANASSDFAILVDAVSRIEEHVYPLTRRARWGTAAGSPGLVIDPWLELCLVYLTTVDTQGADDRVTLLLGYDNSYYYGVLLTAVAIALGEERLLPSRFITNRFLQLDGSKFSTSRGHAVWADDPELTHERINAVRVKLLRNAPEGSESSVSASQILSRSEEDPLLESIEKCRRRFRDLVGATGGTVPSTGAWTAEHKAFYASMLHDLRSGNQLSEELSFSARAYVRLVEAIVDRYEVHLERELLLTEYSGLAEERRTGGALAAVGLKQLASFLWPVAPALAQQIWSTDLRLSGTPVRSSTVIEFLEGGTFLGEQVPTTEGHK